MRRSHQTGGFLCAKGTDRPIHARHLLFQGRSRNAQIVGAGFLAGCIAAQHDQRLQIGIRNVPCRNQPGKMIDVGLVIQDMLHIGASRVAIVEKTRCQGCVLPIGDFPQGDGYRAGLHGFDQFALLVGGIQAHGFGRDLGIEIG